MLYFLFAIRRENMFSIVQGVKIAMSSIPIQESHTPITRLKETCTSLQSGHPSFQKATYTMANLIAIPLLQKERFIF